MKSFKQFIKEKNDDADAFEKLSAMKGTQIEIESNRIGDSRFRLMTIDFKSFGGIQSETIPVNKDTKVSGEPETGHYQIFESVNFETPDRQSIHIKISYPKSEHFSKLERDLVKADNPDKVNSINSEMESLVSKFEHIDLSHGVIEDVQKVPSNISQ